MTFVVLLSTHVFFSCFFSFSTVEFNCRNKKRGEISTKKPKKNKQKKREKKDTRKKKATKKIDTNSSSATHAHELALWERRRRRQKTTTTMRRRARAAVLLRSCVASKRERPPRDVVVANRRTRSGLFASSSSSSSSSSNSADVCVAIGSNLGAKEEERGGGEESNASSSRFQHFHTALRLLEERGFQIKKLAGVYESKPMDTLIENQPKFLNSAVVLGHPREWSILECLKKMKDIEREMGRDVHNTDKGPRVIDLDILFSEKEPMVRYDPPSFSHEKFWLEVPHRRIKERAFVLAPIADLTEKMDFDKNGDVSITMANQMTAMAKLWRKKEKKVLQTTNFEGNEDDVLLQRVVPFKRNMKLEPYEKRSRIMGVLNVTPDSFSDGGVFNTSVSTALRRAEQLVDEGARIIDVGGQSTRPGASRVSAADEIARVAPVLKAICERFKNDPRNVAVSVDTFYGEVVKAADEIGVDIINDVSGGDWDAEMLSAVANTKVPLAYILSHQRGSPDIMDENASYEIGSVAKTVGDEISSQFFQKILPSHISAWRCWIDPGFGFAKSEGQCVELLSDLQEVRASLARNGCGGLAQAPMLVGMSRKRFVGNMIVDEKGEDVPKETRDIASAAAAVVALMNGANAIRAHDVKLHAGVARVADAVATSKSKTNS